MAVYTVTVQKIYDQLDSQHGFPSFVIITTTYLDLERGANRASDSELPLAKSGTPSSLLIYNCYQSSLFTSKRRPMQALGTTAVDKWTKNP